MLAERLERVLLASVGTGVEVQVVEEALNDVVAGLDAGLQSPLPERADPGDLDERRVLGVA